jgi:hypothetical protein
MRVGEGLPPWRTFRRIALAVRDCGEAHRVEVMCSLDFLTKRIDGDLAGSLDLVTFEL